VQGTITDVFEEVRQLQGETELNIIIISIIGGRQVESYRF
jgi:hypothetical protein